MRHVERYIAAFSGRRLRLRTRDDVSAYLSEPGVLSYKTGWLFRQAVDAVRCFFDFVEVPWGRGKRVKENASEFSYNPLYLL